MEKNNRVIVLGTGSSLTKMNPVEIDQFHSVGVNRIYKYYDPDVYIDLQNHSKGWNKWDYDGNGLKITGTYNFREFGKYDIYVNFTGWPGHFYKDMPSYSKTSTFFALWYAYSLRPPEINLLGIDFSKGKNGEVDFTGNTKARDSQVYLRNEETVYEEIDAYRKAIKIIENEGIKVNNLSEISRI
jgi:hypothetical protein